MKREREEWGLGWGEYEEYIGGCGKE